MRAHVRPRGDTRDSLLQALEQVKCLRLDQEGDMRVRRKPPDKLRKFDKGSRVTAQRRGHVERFDGSRSVKHGGTQNFTFSSTVVTSFHSGGTLRLREFRPVK